ncbi:MAG: hydrogenase maturation protease [Bacteroidetes bacterium]|nr:hydrogenase maturation protease [Bacteroidota bacterium]
MPKESKIVLCGIGNTLRSDDGVGALVCREMEQLKIDGLTTFVFHQLHVELVETFKKFEYIIIVDACMEGEGISFYPLDEHKASSASSSHHVDASFFYRLFQQLYPSKKQFFLCAIRGENFELGESISDYAKKNAAKAIRQITTFLYEQGVSL